MDELRIKIEQLIEDLENETANRNINDMEEGRYKTLCEVLDLIDEQKKWGDIMTNMTLKELIEYERELCSLQQEYEGKLTKIYGEDDSSNEKRRLTIVLNLIIEERQKVNRQKYKPV